MSENCEYCNAEMKTSKKGNLYCTNICWEKEPYKTQRKITRQEREEEIQDAWAYYDAENYGDR